MERGGFRLKLDVQDQVSGKILDLDRQGGGGLENWKIIPSDEQNTVRTQKSFIGNELLENKCTN